jgi:lysophospholipase L1-like esterase
VAFAWGAGELLVRFLIPTSTVSYRFDPEVGYLLEPGKTFRWVSPDYDVKVVTNGAGFHDVEHAVAKPPGTYRILVIGDSMVEALQVPVAEAFTRLLEERVNDWAGRPVEVLNLGISGKGPAQYLRLLERVGLAYQPDLVIYAVTLINDFANDVPEIERDPTKGYYLIEPDGSLRFQPPQADAPASRRREEPLRPSVWVKAAIKRSQFLRSIVEKVRRVRATEERHQGAGTTAERSLPVRSEWNVFLAAPPPPWDQAYAVTLRVLEESARLARERGARFVIMLIPPKALVEDKLDAALRADGLGGADGLRWDPGRPTRAIEELGRKQGIPVIDLDAVLRGDYARSGESASWEHDGHWSPRGHRLTAEALDQYLHAHAAELGLSGAS